MPVRQATHSKWRQPTRTVFALRGSGLVLTRTGLLFFARPPGMTDSIGLLITEFWAQCPIAHRSIYSADGTSWYAAETIITNIEASEFLNDGGELGGSAAKGYFQYLDGTDEAILRRAYRWAEIPYVEPDEVFFGGDNDVTLGGEEATW